MGATGHVVRMKETMVMVRGLHTIDVLHDGKEYDLPKEFATYLIMKRKAEYRPGRLKNFAPREINKFPERKERVNPFKVLLLGD